MPNKDINALLETTYLVLNSKNMGDSDIDISFKSTSDVDNIDKTIKSVNQVDKFVKTDSLTQSDRPSDGYETCMDESLSEDNKNIVNSKPIPKLCKTEFSDDVIEVQNVNTKTNGTINANNDIEDLTPTNSRVNIATDQFFLDVPNSSGITYNSTGKVYREHI